jgi:hypothetical protein
MSLDIATDKVASVRRPTRRKNDWPYLTSLYRMLRPSVPPNLLFEPDNSYALAEALVSRTSYDTLNRGAAGVGD